MQAQKTAMTSPAEAFPDLINFAPNQKPETNMAKVVNWEAAHASAHTPFNVRLTVSITLRTEEVVASSGSWALKAFTVAMASIARLMRVLTMAACLRS